jgi:hypothetical protein
MLQKIVHLLLDSKKNRLLFFSFLGIFIFLVSHSYGMFDDDILFGSKMGNQLYYNSIFNWVMPNSFDPGHPPFLGFILAIFWKIFGHQLWVSHLAIFPFIVGFLYQLHNFIHYFISNKFLLFFAFILIIIDPSLSTCFVLVNMEIITFFFFFLALNGILFSNKSIKFIGLFFLSIVSYRSMMLFSGLFIFDVFNTLLLDKEKIKSLFNIKFLSIYFVGCLPGVAFVLWRLLTKGWLQTHPNSPWSGLWNFADFRYFIRNLIVLIWRYLDFGRIFIMLFIVTSFFIFGKKIFQSKKNKQLLLLSISSVIFIIVTILSVTNSVGIRYFIVSYICFNLLAFLILSNFFKTKKNIYAILFLGLITGNFWVYPKEISQGWRATLGHIPYHSLRLEAIDYLNNEHIDVTEVGSFFPNYTTLDLIDLKGDKRSFEKFNGKNKYVFYASTYNLSDEERDLLNNNYIILKKFHKFNTTINIYILKK